MNAEKVNRAEHERVSIITSPRNFQTCPVNIEEMLAIVLYRRGAVSKLIVWRRQPVWLFICKKPICFSCDHGHWRFLTIQQRSLTYRQSSARYWQPSLTGQAFVIKDGPAIWTWAGDFCGPRCKVRALAKDKLLLNFQPDRSPRLTLRTAVMLSTMAISWKRSERKTCSHRTRFGPGLRIVSCMAKIPSFD